eukprot:jgi/Ulvmu1/6073/UM027_0051.1
MTQVQTAARYRLTLEVDMPRGEFAAWAGVIAAGRSGRYEGVSYLSARDGTGADLPPGGNRWSEATVRLGMNAARQSAQARWYYVSSVITGEGAAGVAWLRRWRLSVRALVSGHGRSGGRSAVEDCDEHSVDFLTGVTVVLCAVLASDAALQY